MESVCASPPVVPSEATLQAMIQLTQIAASLHECNGQGPASDGSNCDDGNPPGYTSGKGEKPWAVEWDDAWIANYGQLVTLLTRLG